MEFLEVLRRSGVGGDPAPWLIRKPVGLARWQRRHSKAHEYSFLWKYKNYFSVTNQSTYDKSTTNQPSSLVVISEKNNGRIASPTPLQGRG